MTNKLWDAEDARKEAQEELLAAVKKVVSAGNLEIKELLVHMMKWSPQCGFPKNVSPTYWDPEDDSKEKYRRTKNLDNPDLPFFSETYLYELLGKDDARTVLGYIGSLARAIGYQGLWDLQREVQKNDDASRESKGS
jgi:hypothetical protein